MRIRRHIGQRFVLRSEDLSRPGRVRLDDAVARDAAAISAFRLTRSVDRIMACLRSEDAVAGSHLVTSPSGIDNNAIAGDGGHGLSRDDASGETRSGVTDGGASTIARIRPDLSR